MGILIYCTTRDEVERVVASLRNQVVVSSTRGDEFQDTMEAFVRGEANVLVTSTQAAVTGWRAPPGTIVLFSSTFPEGPERLQAAARVGEGGATGGW